MAVVFDKTYIGGYEYMSKHSPVDGSFYGTKADLYVYLSKNSDVSMFDTSFYHKVSTHQNIGLYYGCVKLESDQTVPKGKFAYVFAYEKSPFSFSIHRGHKNFFKNTLSIIKNLSFTLAYVHSKNLLFTGLKFRSSYIYYPEHNLVKISLKKCYPIGSRSANKHSIESNYADLVDFCKSFLHGDLNSSLSIKITKTPTIPRYPCLSPKGRPKPNRNYLRAYVAELTHFFEELMNCDSALKLSNHPLFWPPRTRLHFLEDVYMYARGIVFDPFDAKGGDSSAARDDTGSAACDDTGSAACDDTGSARNDSNASGVLYVDGSDENDVSVTADTDLNNKFRSALTSLSVHPASENPHAVFAEKWRKLPLPVRVGLGECENAYDYLRIVRNLLAHGSPCYGLLRMTKREYALLTSYEEYHDDKTKGMDLCLSYYLPDFFMSVYSAALSNVDLESANYLTMYLDPSYDWESV